MKFCLGIFGYCSLCQGSQSDPASCPWVLPHCAASPPCHILPVPSPQSPKNGEMESGHFQQH